VIRSLSAVRAELVEAPPFLFGTTCAQKERPFDKLRANGILTL